MTREEIIKQNRQCIETVKRKQTKRLQEINDKIVEIDYDKAILEKELHIMILEKEIRNLEAEKREIEKYLISQ